MLVVAYEKERLSFGVQDGTGGYRAVQDETPRTHTDDLVVNAGDFTRCYRLVFVAVLVPWVLMRAKPDREAPHGR